MKLLEDKVKAESLTIMTQKEVADRIGAGPGTKSYGALSIAVQFYCQVEKDNGCEQELIYPGAQCRLNGAEAEIQAAACGCCAERTALFQMRKGRLRTETKDIVQFNADLAGGKQGFDKG